jgi:MFS family permease
MADPVTTAPEATNGAQSRDERSLAELVRELSDQSTRLARMEVELAKAELAQKGRQLGAGAGAFGGAGAVGFYAFGALTAALILGLAEAVGGWVAALAVGALYGVVAGALALAGKRRIEAGTPPAPERAIRSAKLDLEAAKRGAREGRP